MKKFVRIALLVAAWAAVSWLYRDKLLPLPRPERGPAPHFRTGRAAGSQPVASTAASPQDPASTHDDLTEIVGIGPVYRNRLAGAGIVSFADLAAADPDVVAEAIDVADSLVAGWITQAREMGH